ncbi:E3 ubiquitin-protein ligase DTX4-like isoform X2 [Ptychodera flava]|uniref:E3 ubiquitin-protein ligase DTX4-like isoform X2 n=1 Tax=Ptychodera flava TaxID=63121 RepID=UPI003969CF03
MATGVSHATFPAVVVWEWLNDHGRWRPYDPSAVQKIEKAYSDGVNSFQMSNADLKLASYVADFSLMQQLCSTTGSARPIRRHKYPANSAPAKGIVWQWLGDMQGSWSTYDIEICCLLETAHENKQKQIDLNLTACRLPYIVDIGAMIQIRNESGFTRHVRRLQLPSGYPLCDDAGSDSRGNNSGRGGGASSSYKLKHSISAPCGISDSHPGVVHSKIRRSNSTKLSQSDSNNSRSAVDTTGSTNSMDSTTDDTTPSTSDVVSPSSDSGIVTSASGSLIGMATASLPSSSGSASSSSSASTSALTALPVPMSCGRMVRNDCKPVPGVKPPKKRRRLSLMKVTDPEDVLKHYVSKVKKPPKEDCPICFEELCCSSGYEENKATSIVFKLEKCRHIFHKSCLAAMYNSGPKDGSLQCPTCKAIYGVKHGNQPPGSMDYHVIPYSLPGYRDCDSIRVIYNIPPGTQGPEHPHPGKRYSARGFPRHCYLPNNEKGRKVLRLLILAWDRRLIFTISTSATTGEANTVTWNEIHHKTEFGSNLTGHGYPDPQYLDNVLMELQTQGVTEDDL